MNRHNICEAVDQIDALRAQAADAACGALTDASPELVTALEGMLKAMALVLRLFHHTFDYPIDPASLSENEDELMAWAAGYDKGYASSLSVLKRCKT